MHEEAVDAAGGVDAQIAPTPPWKSRRRFPQAPTAVVDSVMRRYRERRSRLRAGEESDDTQRPYRVAGFQTFFSGRI